MSLSLKVFNIPPVVGNMSYALLTETFQFEVLGPLRKAHCHPNLSVLSGRFQT